MVGVKVVNESGHSLRDETLCTVTNHNDSLGAVTVPVYQTATFRFDSTEQVAAFARGESDHYLYTRYGNPTLAAAEAKVAALERGRCAYLFASGVAALAAWCTAYLRPEDRFVVSDRLYGGTVSYLNHCLVPMGVQVDHVDFADLDGLAAALHGARCCWFETPTNPTLGIIDGEAVAGLCRNHKVMSAVDNTFATPINQKPLDWGIDWVMHSVTKYLNGHSDLIGGVLVAGQHVDPEPLQKVRRTSGAIMDPHAAFLLERGLKTLAIRVDRQNGNAMALARYLQDHPAVSLVHYPGLPGHPGNEIARRQMRGFGGMLAIDLAGGYKAAARMIDRLRLIVNAASLGGVESLVSMPVLTSHAHATAEERVRAGVTDGTVRISVGIEFIDDLIGDVAQALAEV